MKEENKMQKPHSILLRIISSPFLFALLMVGSIYKVCRMTVFFIMYGGEFLAYEKRTMIGDVYEKVCELVDKKEQ